MTAALGRGRGPTVTGFLVADARRWSLGLDRAGRDLRTFSDEAAQVGLGISAGIGAGLVASTAAAINWQSAFTGVRKTVEGTPEELNQLAGELRDLAIELGLFPEQVAAIAEAAGQLGVSTQGIDEFTEVIGQLSQTTVLQAEEAAVSLARFAEVTGLIEMEYDELGSTIVALGNNFATNEAEIVALSQRLSSYGEIIGLSEAQTLAFATAASSVDLEAEAAGTALGRTFITIREAVDEGGDSLDTFAQVAGVTAQEFATAFSTDPAFAIEQFITGLGRLESSGQSSTAALEELGLSDVRVTRTLLTLANAGDLLNETLVTAETAWAENTALVDEFNERAEDTAFKLRQLVGSLIELGIVFGEDLEPVVGGLAAGLAVVVGEFSDVPPLVRTSTVVIASFTAATLAAASAAQLLGGKLTNARQQWAAFQAARAGSLVGRLTRAAAIAGTLGISIGAAATAMELLGRASETTAENVERIGRSTDEELAGIVDVALELEGALGNVFRNEFSDILDELQLQGAGGIDTLERLAAALELREGERAEFQLAAVSEALDLARQRARDTGQAVDDTGDSFNDLSIEASTLAAEVNAAVSEFLDGADAAELLRMELDGLIGTVDEAAGIGQDFERTLGDLVEAADDAGTSLDSFTDAGQQNQDLLAEAASQAREYSQAILEQTGSVDLADAAFRGQIGTLIEVATQLGFTRGQVLDYLASLGLIPASVVTEMLGDPSSALAAADAVTSAIFGVPTGVNIAFGADTRNLESALRVINAALGVFGGPQLSVEDFGDFLVRPSVRAGNIIGGTRSGGGGGGGGGGGADGPTELEIELERLAELYEFDRITRQ
ncbi:MAG: phage tail tape measure protein, partial [Actinomycetota bacterium]